MDRTAIIGLFVGAVVLTVLFFNLHAHWAGNGEEAPGALAMVMFVAGWLCVITVVFSGTFLATLLFTGG